MTTRDLQEALFPEVDFKKDGALATKLAANETQLTMEFSKWCYKHCDTFEALFEYYRPVKSTSINPIHCE